MELLDIIGKSITDIWIKQFDQNTLMFERVRIQTNDICLELNVDQDTDELILIFLSKESPIDYSEFTKFDLGKVLEKRPIIGLWTATNQNGYFDVFMIGTKEFKPNVIIASMASQITVDIIT